MQCHVPPPSVNISTVTHVPPDDHVPVSIELVLQMFWQVSSNSWVRLVAVNGGVCRNGSYVALSAPACVNSSTPDE